MKNNSTLHKFQIVTYREIAGLISVFHSYDTHVVYAKSGLIANNYASKFGKVISCTMLRKSSIFASKVR